MSEPRPDESPDWYLQEWMAHFRKRQAALVNELGWSKGRASKYWTGFHPYKREVLNEVADFLGIEPYELLLPPQRALAIRRMFDTARAIANDAPVAQAAEKGRRYESAPAAPRAPSRPVTHMLTGKTKK